MQLEATAEALRRDFGVIAEVSSELEPVLDGFDLVHLFGLVRPQEVWVQARNATRQGKPVVLSTVYCDVWEYEQRGRRGPLGLLARHTNRDAVEALKAAGRGVMSREWTQGSAALFSRGFTEMQRAVVKMTAVFLPNSHSEWNRIVTTLGVQIPADRVVVVPNAVTPPPPAFRRTGEQRRATEFYERFRGCVLCVARVEGRKNQLNLIAATRQSDVQVVVAGQAAANQGRYVAAVRALAHGSANVHLLGSVTEAEKWALYRAAAVHALPSWIETTGLSSLEAASMDCALVVSPNGDTEEYFGQNATYCDPASRDSIAAAIRQARTAGPSAELKKRIADHLTWTQAAQMSLQGYHRALAGSAAPRPAQASNPIKASA